MRRTKAGAGARLVVVDNMSADDSVDIAQGYGAEVIRRPCSQPSALQQLAGMSRSPRTLLMPANVVPLHPDWFEVCASALRGATALVSPEDIGCGPWTRPFGRGMPESSFLLWDTAGLRRISHWLLLRFGRFRRPRRKFPFHGAHITHHVPMHLTVRGYT